MSTIVYHELQSSCNNESYFTTESRTLSLKLSSSKHSQTSSNSFPELSSKSQNGPENTSSSSSSSAFGGWSTIESLPSKKDGNDNKEEGVYVHPLVKRSSFMLSEKSLAMCTESLGNETGACDMESSFFLPSTAMEERKPRQVVEKKKKEFKVDHGKFPPPLTTISGSNTIHVKQYRENGRLVLEAVSSPPTESIMQAERSDGRLKLTMVRESESPSDIDFDNDNDNDNDDEDDTYDYPTKDDNEVESFVENFEEEESDVEEECNKGDANLLEEMNGKKVEFGVNLGLGKIQRLSRCKEGSQRNKRLINLEPFWVAT